MAPCWERHPQEGGAAPCALGRAGCATWRHQCPPCWCWTKHRPADRSGSTLSAAQSSESSVPDSGSAVSRVSRSPRRQPRPLSISVGASPTRETMPSQLAQPGCMLIRWICLDLLSELMVCCPLVFKRSFPNQKSLTPRKLRNALPTSVSITVSGTWCSLVINILCA